LQFAIVAFAPWLRSQNSSYEWTLIRTCVQVSVVMADDAVASEKRCRGA
jgi:hypothetical protein